MPVLLSTLIASTQNELGDAAGKHPAWTASALLAWWNLANRQYQAVTRCYSAAELITLVADPATEEYDLAELCGINMAALKITDTFSRQCEVVDAYDPNWVSAGSGPPRAVSIQRRWAAGTPAGLKLTVGVYPTPASAGTLTIYGWSVTGWQLSSDNTILTDHTAYEPRHLVKALAMVAVQRWAEAEAAMADHLRALHRGRVAVGGEGKL